MRYTLLYTFDSSSHLHVSGKNNYKKVPSILTSSEIYKFESISLQKVNIMELTDIATIAYNPTARYLGSAAIGTVTGVAHAIYELATHKTPFSYHEAFAPVVFATGLNLGLNLDTGLDNAGSKALTASLSYIVAYTATRTVARKIRTGRWL